MPIQKITSGVIESSQTLTTPTISGNLSLDSTGTTGVRVPSANTFVFHTAGTEDMRIDSSGRVTMSAQPCFYAYTYSNTTQGIVKTFDNIETNVGSYYNNTNGRFTAPVAGNYYFFASAYYHNDTNAISGYIHWLFAKNGVSSWNEGYTPYNIYGHGTIANHTDGINVHAIMFLNVGDYCSILPYWGGTVGRFYSDYHLFTGSFLGVV